MPHINLVDPRICSPVHRIILLETAPGSVRGKLLDNVHEFSLILTHDGQTVLSIVPGALRVPWTTCNAALPHIDALVGSKLTQNSGSAIEKKLQCTHLFDLARLTMAHAARKGGQRRYDLNIEVGETGGTINGVALRDGAVALVWAILENRVVSPGPFQGHIIVGPARWPEGLSADDMEAALLLRRTLLVFRGRGLSADAKRASDMPYMAGVCHSFQPGPMAAAIRPPDFFDYPVESVSGFLCSRT